MQWKKLSFHLVVSTQQASLQLPKATVKAERNAKNDAKGDADGNATEAADDAAAADSAAAEAATPEVPSLPGINKLGPNGKP